MTSVVADLATNVQVLVAKVKNGTIASVLCTIPCPVIILQQSVSLKRRYLGVITYSTTQNYLCICLQ